MGQPRRKVLAEERRGIVPDSLRTASRDGDGGRGGGGGGGGGNLAPWVRWPLAGCARQPCVSASAGVPPCMLSGSDTDDRHRSMTPNESRTTPLTDSQRARRFAFEVRGDAPAFRRETCFGPRSLPDGVIVGFAARDFLPRDDSDPGRHSRTDPPPRESAPAQSPSEHSFSAASSLPSAAGSTGGAIPQSSGRPSQHSFERKLKRDRTSSTATA
jgi:hypothetical protein